MKTDINENTVRPRLSGHIGTVTYPDKRIVQIWELCLNTASSVAFIQVTMHLLIDINPLCFCFDVEMNEK